MPPSPGCSSLTMSLSSVKRGMFFLPTVHGAEVQCSRWGLPDWKLRPCRCCRLLLAPASGSPSGAETSLSASAASSSSLGRTWKRWPAPRLAAVREVTELAVESELWQRCSDRGLGAEAPTSCGRSSEEGVLLTDLSAASRSSAWRPPRAARSSRSWPWPTRSLATSSSSCGRASRRPAPRSAAGPPALRATSSRVTSDCRSRPGSPGPDAPGRALPGSRTRRSCSALSASWARDSWSSSETTDCATAS
mmetsp:Transcript_37155/g.107036  ORF Transcript_37155/g.107036 Transcript_37155/m.107036 type:complete len:249 (+) Transcript_37155:465-1211(+)